MTKDQTANIIRHTGTFIAGALSLAGAFAIFDPEQVVAFTKTFTAFTEGLVTLSNGIFQIAAVVGPVLAFAMARWGSHAVGPANQLVGVSSMADVKVLVGPDAPHVAQVAADDKKLDNVIPVSGNALQAAARASVERLARGG